MKPSFNALLLVAALIICGGYYVNSKFESSKNSELEEWADDYRDYEEEEAETAEVLFDRDNYETLNYSQEEMTNPTRIKVKILNGGYKIIKVTDIMYCESRNEKVYITTDVEANEIETSDNLKHIKADIGNTKFVYDDLRKYIINMHYIDKVVPCQANENCRKYDYFIEMMDSKKIKLPKDKKISFQDDLDDFIINAN